MTTVLAALKALIELPAILKSLVDLVSKQFEAMEKARRDEWIAEGQKIEREMLAAKTDKERAQYVKDLVRNRNSMPK